jgi:hypothetical protein
VAFLAVPAAEEAGAAVAARSGASAAGKRAAGKRAAAKSSRRAAAGRNLNDLATADEVNAELQRRRGEAAAAKEAADTATDEAAEETSSAAPKPDTGRDRSRDVGVVAKLDRVDGVHSGAGFVLGLIAWVGVANYLQGGLPQVKKLLRAKFLNKTS